MSLTVSYSASAIRLMNSIEVNPPNSINFAALVNWC